MRIEVQAKLILTVPNPKKEEFAGAADIVLAAEQEINQRMARFYMPKTETQVGIRIHISGKIPKVTE